MSCKLIKGSNWWRCCVCLRGNASEYSNCRHCHHRRCTREEEQMVPKMPPADQALIIIADVGPGQRTIASRLGSTRETMIVLLQMLEELRVQLALEAYEAKSRRIVEPTPGDLVALQTPPRGA